MGERGTKVRARVTGLIALTGGAVLLGSAYLGAVPAAADAVLLSSGWWYLPNQVPNNLAAPPAPPWVPSDGIYVAGTPAGPLAVGAVRYAAEGPATLRLDLTANGQAGIPSVSACTTLNVWDGASAGRWEGRPQYDCANGVKGEISANGAEMVFKLDPKAQRVDGVYDFALVPTGPVPFSTTFNAPKSGDLLLAGGSAPAAAVEDSSAQNGTTESFETGPSFAGSEGALAFSGSDVATGGEAATPGVSSPRPAVPPVLVPTQPVVDSLPLPEDRNQRIAAVGGLALMVLGAWWFGGRTVRPPRLLGSMAARVEPIPVPVDQPPVRGIGRFARPRS
jgi:hypothetical protein